LILNTAWVVSQPRTVVGTGTVMETVQEETWKQLNEANRAGLVRLRSPDSTLAAGSQLIVSI
jgi:hypothetical protein